MPAQARKAAKVTDRLSQKVEKAKVFGMRDEMWRGRGRRKPGRMEKRNSDVFYRSVRMLAPTS